VLLALLIAVVVPGCGSHDAFESTPLPGPYREMLEQVAAERGLPPPTTLRIGTVPRGKLPELLDRVGRDSPEAGDTTTNPTFRLLGLLPGGVDYASAARALLEASARAIYLPARREVWLVREGPLPPSPRDLAPWEQRLLAHEFVHAIQDYHFDLTAMERAAETTDSRLALRALLEGDASWTESRWTATVLLPSLADVGLLEPPTTSQAPPPALGREVAFVYGTGTEWVTLLRGRDGGDVDRTLRAGGPVATTLILHPDIEATGWKIATPALPADAPGGGWLIDGWDRLGEFMLRNYLQTGLASLVATTAAEGWVGDSVVRYRTPMGGSALALRVRFRDAKEAGDFAAAHLDLLKTRAAAVEAGAAMTTAVRGDGITVVQLVPLGDEVTIVFADDTASAAELAGFLLNR
jgi:hypothetical protein